MLRWFCLQGDEPSQSRIRSTAPPRGELFASAGLQRKTSPFRGRWHRAAMTERVNPCAPFTKTAKKLWQLCVNAPENSVNNACTPEKYLLCL